MALDLAWIPGLQLSWNVRQEVEDSDSRKQGHIDNDDEAFFSPPSSSRHFHSVTTDSHAHTTTTIPAPPPMVTNEPSRVRHGLKRQTRRWAPVSFFSSFIILANCSALSFYSNDVKMTTKTGTPYPCTSNDKRRTKGGERRLRRTRAPCSGVPARYVSPPSYARHVTLTAPNPAKPGLTTQRHPELARDDQHAYEQRLVGWIAGANKQCHPTTTRRGRWDG
jgi:hypothetical protein